MNIGIPRTFFFYYYYPFWSVFFKSLGYEITLSPPTNPAILKDGIERTLDEYCLPVKIHRGHVAWLEGKCDYIFSPGYGRNGRKGFFCPKLTGMPDLLRATHSSVVTFWHDFDADGSLNYQQWSQTVHKIDPNLVESRIKQAWQAAVEEEKKFLLSGRHGLPIPDEISAWAEEQLPSHTMVNPRYRLALLGHPYLVYDLWTSGRLIETFQKYETKLFYQENIPIEMVDKKWPFQRKKVYWPVGQETLSAAQYYSQQHDIDGIIHISSCLCGPDAIVGDLLEKYMHQQEGRSVPLLQLTLDEHTGWAGLQTRVEAFMDLLDWRYDYASL